MAAACRTDPAAAVREGGDALVVWAERTGRRLEAGQRCGEFAALADPGRGVGGDCQPAPHRGGVDAEHGGSGGPPSAASPCRR